MDFNLIWICEYIKCIGLSLCKNCAEMDVELAAPLHSVDRKPWDIMFKNVFM